MGTIASPDATTAPDREVLTWEGFGDASRELTQQIVDSGWIPDLIVAIARGGLIPAGAIAYAMDVKAIGTMNVEFYSGIGETLEEPQLLPPLMDVSAMDGKRVLVVDDVADSGKTLKMVMDLIDEHGLTLDGSAAVRVDSAPPPVGTGQRVRAAIEVQGEHPRGRVINVVISLRPGAADAGVDIVSRRVEDDVERILSARLFVLRMKHGEGVALRLRVAPFGLGIVMEELKTAPEEQSGVLWFYF